jgi:hypothetical protein
VIAMRRRRALIAVACGLLMVAGVVVGTAPGCGQPESYYTDLGCPDDGGLYGPSCCFIFGLGCDAPCSKPGAALARCCDEYTYCRTAPMPWIDGGAFSDCINWQSWGCDAGTDMDGSTDGDVNGGDLDGAAE